MNTYTLYLVGKTIGRHAFRSGQACTPMSDSNLLNKIKFYSTPAQKQLAAGWIEGWREAELDNSGW